MTKRTRRKAMGKTILHQMENPVVEDGWNVFLECGFISIIIRA
jgi:hypothetical protein